MGGPPESALGMILFVLLGFGSNSRDVVSYLNADDYFKSRKVEVTVERLLALAATSPRDGKDQVMQLLAIRKLAANPAEAGKDKRVRALLAEIAEGKKGKDRLGFAEDYAKRALAQLDGKEAAPQTMPKDSLRSEAFAWFPKDAALVAAFDMRPGEGIPAAEVTALQTLATKFARESNPEQIYEVAEKLGNIRVDRFAVGVAPDPQGGKENGRIYVRVSGKVDHRRLVTFLRDMELKLVNEEDGGGGQMISILQPKNDPPVFAVVGDSDVLIAGYMRNRGEHMAVLREMLNVRAGMQRGVAAGPLAERLKKADPQTFILMAGDLTKDLGFGPLGAPGVDGKGVMPKSVAMEATRKAKGLDIVLDAVMANADDAQRLAEEAKRTLHEALEDIRREVKRNPEVTKEGLELVTKTLESIKIQAKAANLNLSLHISNDVLKIVPDLLGKIGAFPGGRPLGARRGCDEVEEPPQPVERDRRGAANAPRRANGRRAGVLALRPAA